MTKQHKIFLPCLLTLLGLFSFSSIALAHPGDLIHNLTEHGFSQGLLHPLTGLDHLFSMIAVGVWAAMTHTTLRQALYTPASFLALLFIGAILGLAGFTLPAIEPMIMASLLILGLLVATQLSVPQWAGSAIVGFFALFHGIAHGSELPLGANAFQFVAGFMIATLILHLVGITLGFQLKNRGQWLARAFGAGTALYGIILMINAGG